MIPGAVCVTSTSQVVSQLPQRKCDYKLDLFYAVQRAVSEKAYKLKILWFACWVVMGGFWEQPSG